MPKRARLGFLRETVRIFRPDSSTNQGGVTASNSVGVITAKAKVTSAKDSPRDGGTEDNLESPKYIVEFRANRKVAALLHTKLQVKLRGAVYEIARIMNAGLQ